MAVNYLSTIFCCKIGITDKEYMEEAMSSVQLLDKTRKIGKLLHNNNSSKVVFNDICDVMTDILASNVLVISKKGKVLGTGLRPEVDRDHRNFWQIRWEIILMHLLNERSTWYPFYKRKCKSGDTWIYRWTV